MDSQKNKGNSFHGLVLTIVKGEIKFSLISPWSILKTEGVPLWTGFFVVV
jgi:hypothetical protein